MKIVKQVRTGVRVNGDMIDKVTASEDELSERIGQDIEIGVSVSPMGEILLGIILFTSTIDGFISELKEDK